MRKFLFMFASFLFCAVAPVTAPAAALEEAEVPIVMYHLVTEKQKYIGKYGITPAELERDLQYLQANNYTTVVMRDLIAFVNDGAPLPEKPVMLTFDDGNESDHRYVLPLLEKYDMKAVFAIVGEYSDKYTAEAEKHPTARYPNMTWSQIKELHESGRAEIQSHSWNLHTPPTGSGEKRGESPEAYHARLFADLQRLQQACAAHLNYVPTTYVYPLGVLGKNSRAVLEELGMVASISCQEGRNILRLGDGDCLFRLYRTNRPAGRPIEEILESIKHHTS